MSAPPRVYTPHVLVANWFDARKEPSFPGTRPSVVTETQIRAAETNKVPQPTFGASLRSTYAHIRSIEENFDYVRVAARAPFLRGPFFRDLAHHPAPAPAEQPCVPRQALH